MACCSVLVDGAPTATEDHGHLGEVAGAAGTAEGGEVVVEDNLVLPPIHHSDTVAGNKTAHDTILN